MSVLLVVLFSYFAIGVGVAVFDHRVVGKALKEESLAMSAAVGALWFMLLVFMLWDVGKDALSRSAR